MYVERIQNHNFGMNFGRRFKSTKQSKITISILMRKNVTHSQNIYTRGCLSNEHYKLQLLGSVKLENLLYALF